ncbi:MAG: FmdB family zinc ribbon protein [Armatimonadota bacterium]
MPTYDYRCEKCGQVFEIRHGFDEGPPDSCCADACDGTLRRVFSPPTIIFKGSGWHVTDYGSGSTSSASKIKDRAKDSADEAAAASSSD